MFGILGFILIFILFVLLIGLVLIGNIFRFIFGWGKRSPKRYDGSQSGQSDYVHTLHLQQRAHSSLLRSLI